MGLRFYDAHNHLQDERLSPALPRVLQEVESEGIAGAVVNGSCEQDWPRVLSLARQHSWIIPSFGYHPWYVKERSPDWEKVLAHFLDQMPAAIGEIGLDRWIEGYDSPQQEEVFLKQWRMAIDRNLPVSVHCLQAWGRLYEILREEPRLPYGFLLHSYGGPQEMVKPLAELGAYFSLPGYFAHPRKERQRETFRHVPPDRLLIETDAPDQPLPAARIQYPLQHPATGKPLNHPGNLKAVYEFAAEITGEALEPLSLRVEANFQRLFRNVTGQDSRTAVAG